MQHEPARWLVLPCQHGQGLKLMRSAPACVIIQSACNGGALWVPEILPADFRKFWPVGEGHRECLRREAVRPRASAVWGVA